MKKTTIDWRKIWDDFTTWLNKLEDTKACELCGSHEDCFPDWDDQ